jgi:hypothetical protein
MLQAHRVSADSACVALGAHLAANKNLKRKEVGPEPFRLLRLAWQHELATRVSGQIDDIEFTKASAGLLSVKVYYALFNGLRALTAAAGAPASTHAATLAWFAKNESRFLPLPFSLRLTGDPRDIETCRVEPEAVSVGEFVPERDGGPADGYVFAALRMARKWQLEQVRERWLAATKKPGGVRYKNLPPGKYNELTEQLRPTTLFGLLLRAPRQGELPGRG